jgi:DNA repair protein RAD5
LISNSDPSVGTLRDQDPLLHAVVFSQFTGFLDLIEIALDRDKIPWLRLDGSMSQTQRSKVLREFSSPSKSPRIFLISLRAGGVGLNLTTANYVFMVRLTKIQGFHSCMT